MVGLIFIGDEMVQAHNIQILHQLKILYDAKDGGRIRFTGESLCIMLKNNYIELSEHQMHCLLNRYEYINATLGGDGKFYYYFYEDCLSDIDQEIRELKLKEFLNE